MGGKRKEHSLDTSDQKSAERALKRWIADLETTDTESAKIVLSVSIEKFIVASLRKSPEIPATNQAIINVLKKTGSHGLDSRSIFRPLPEIRQ